MSDTSTQSVEIDLADYEYAKPCQIRAACDEPAVVFMIQSHTNDAGCPGRGRFFCQRHYERKRDQMARWITGARRCPLCGSPISGTLKDHVKVIWL